MNEYQRRIAAGLIKDSYCELINGLWERQASTDQVRDEVAVLNDEWADLFGGARAAAADRIARRWGSR